MIFLKSDEWFQIPGKGLVAAFGKDTLPEDVYHPGVLVNEWVIIDGKPYYVTGVDMFGPGIHPNYSRQYPYKLPFGLVVRNNNDQSTNRR